MQHYVSKSVVCPFYSQESQLRIHCEGIGFDNRLQLCFNSLSDKRNFKWRYCECLERYTKCPLYKAIYTKYDEEDKR